MLMGAVLLYMGRNLRHRDSFEGKALSEDADPGHFLDIVENSQ